MTQKVLIVVPDLMFSTRIADTARAGGFTPVDARLATLSAAIDDDVALIVLDMGQPGDWQSVIRALKADPATAGVPLLAFGPHVDVTASRAAVAAGTDRIVTRGKLAAELPQLIEKTARRSGRPTTNDQRPTPTNEEI